MIRLISEKIKNKLIMTSCLVMGLALLSAAITCQPMYKTGSLNRVLKTNFDEYVTDYNTYPTVITKSEPVILEESSLEDSLARYDATRDKMTANLSELGLVENQRIITLDRIYRGQKCFPDGSTFQEYSDITKNSSIVIPVWMPGIKEHANITDYMDGIDTSKYYPCVVSMNTVHDEDLYMGEILRFNDIKDDSGNPLLVIISGVYEPKDINDPYFYEKFDDTDQYIVLDEADMKEIVDNYNMKELQFIDHYLYEYKNINATNIGGIKAFIDSLTADETITETFTPHLNAFYLDKSSIDVTLWVMELPLLAMILSFIYMVSKQIVGSEVSEIAIFKSRGLSTIQVIIIYLYQSVILGLIGMIIGVPLGLLMCKLAGSTTDFLNFDFSSAYMYSITLESIGYALISFVVGIICVIIPVIASASVSIVQVKSNYSYDKKSIWEKIFLDVILLALSLYLLYNYMNSTENIRQNALSGKLMDPFTFIDTFLFLVAAGMVFVRLIRMLVKLIYKLGKSKWKSETYVAFLQTIRNYNSQMMIAIFLMLTIAFGIFYSNTARTINSNKIERIHYNIGGQMRTAEKWKINTYRDSENRNNYRYKEPEFGRYVGLTEEGICSSYTKVMTNKSTIVSRENKQVDKCLVYGINTKEFGETAILKDGLGDTHWFNYLNELALKPQGVLLSRNLAESLGVDVGDTVKLNRMSEYEQFKDISKGILMAKVVGIVDAWPGYEQYIYEDVTDKNGDISTVEKEQYLAVINYSAGEYEYGITPYEVWYRLADGATLSDVEDYLERTGITPAYVLREDEEVHKMKESLDIQIINGMFTLGFVVALVVCVAGFLIYWITSIRKRELQFGVYRAMGMSVEQINKMLVTEHMLSTAFNVFAGLIEGVVATLLFVKLFSIVYLPERHNLDIYMYYETGDFIRLGIVILMMLISCIIIIRRQMKKLNITAALKLGEE